MKLTKQSKTKLDLIRLEGLCKLILNKYDEDDVISKISNVTKSIPKDNKAIYKLSITQFKKFIELSNITNEDIDKSYEEYLQTSNDIHDKNLQMGDHACGSLCVARVKEMPVILEFTSFQDTIMFHKRGRFGLEKVQNSEINVKVVLDMECGNI